MSRKPLLGFLPILALFAACLENLHEQKYFDTLERKNPALYATVIEHRPKIEEQLNNALRESLDREVREIGMWGARWDHVRIPVEGDILYMKGRILYQQGPSDTYALSFQVTSEGEVTILAKKVYQRRVSASSEEVEL